MSEYDMLLSLRFAEGALAASGHLTCHDLARDDALSALKGEISFDEAVRRATVRAVAVA